MKYRALGHSGMVVSEMALGGVTFGGSEGFWQNVGQLGESEVESLVGTALDAGVNLLDTADAYSQGESEILLGKALNNLARPRDQVVVTTKVWARMGPGPNQAGLSRLHIMHAVEESLRRLDLSHIDLYVLHGWDPLTPWEETLSALDDLVQSGKVRYLGFSNLPAWMAMKALALQADNGWHRFINGQVYYSLPGRYIERELVPFAIDQGVGITAWGPLAAGLLSGKYDLDGESQPENARRTHVDFPPVNRARARACLDAMSDIAARHDASLAQVAIAWLLHKDHVASVIVGVRTIEQLRDNLAATEVSLTEDDMAALDQASELPGEYPGWMLEYQGQAPRM